MTTENLFTDPARKFIMRRDAGKKDPPCVEWYKFESGNDFPVAYFYRGAINSVDQNGFFRRDELQDERDLIPFPEPPILVPWETPDDVPECWVRDSDALSKLDDFRHSVQKGWMVLFNGEFIQLKEMLDNHREWHTDRLSKTGWQPCGKVKP